MSYEDEDGNFFPKLLENHNKDIGEIKREISGFA
jgi:hypothetical protein